MKDFIKWIIEAVKNILGYLLLAVGAVALGFLAIGDVIITLLKIFSGE